MSRRLEIGSLLLTPTDARVLYQVANLGALRTRFRVGDTRVYELLTEISIAAFTSDDAESGIEARHSAASEEREWWTTEQLALATGRATRTVRNDVANHLVPAVKHNNGWLIRADHAQTYIDGNRRTT